MSALFDAHVVATRGGFGVDVALRAGAGETLVVVGPNGAGKSTVLHALAGLVPLAGGYVRVDGRPVGASAPARRPFGVVFQDGLLFPHMSVLDNVAFGLRARGMRRSDANAHAAALLGRFGLAAVATAHPRALSGGQAQRVAIAMALALRSEILIADEPTSALDVTVQAEIFEALRRLREERRIAILFISHDLAALAELCDRIAVMRRGEIVEEGPAARVLTSPRHPYTAELVAAVPTIGSGGP